MFDFGKIDFSSPSSNFYYLPYIISVGIIYLILHLIERYHKTKGAPEGKHNKSMDQTFKTGGDYEPQLLEERNKLKLNYLIVYILTRSAMWAKAPYLYTLFATVHKFTMVEIGQLYLVDAVAAFIFGPITGQYADIYGRRLFCNIYNLSIVVNLLLRMHGSHVLAYLAQIATGLGAGLINTTFEAWVVTQANKVFQYYPSEKDRFLKRLFRDANNYDTVSSITVSFICAIVYSYLGIYSPLIISIVLSLLAMIASQLLWEENKPAADSKKSAWSQFREALTELEKTDVLCVGLIEGIIMAVLGIFLFSWTPVLKMSTNGNINVGLIYTCLLLTMLVGIKVYSIFILYLKANKYLSLTVSIFFESTMFIAIYFDNSFFRRLIYLSLINGYQGFYNPLNSIIKSGVIIDLYRASLMNIFRIPLNIYTIIVFFTLRFMNPFTVTFVTGLMSFTAGIISVYLLRWSLKHEPKEEELYNSYINIEKDEHEQGRDKINLEESLVGGCKNNKIEHVDEDL